MSTVFDNATLQRAKDAALCAAAVAGDRAAFGQIVERYQNLVCSIAYSALGDVGRSEDLAQETFIIAWRKLADLQEPEKLKGWLCGIARNLISNFRRRRATDLESHAETLNTHAPVSCNAPAPLDQVIRREEEALLWSVLSTMPQTYREPLVLYHRGQCSVAEVAVQLDLTEDAVKQRLSRGRKLLKDEMVALVEKTLRASRPGRAFTLAVLASLPGLGATTAMAGTLGTAGNAAGPWTAKVGAGFFSTTVWGPLLGLFGAAFGLWAADQSAHFPRERKFYRKSVVFYIAVLTVFLMPLLLMSVGAWNPMRLFGPLGYVLALTSWTSTFWVATWVWSWAITRRWRRIVAEEVAARSRPLPATPLRRFMAQWEGRQWTSRWTFLGLPLVDIRFSDPHPDNIAHALGHQWRRQVARGWIACGDRAYGLVAVGGLAVGGLAFGGISIGGVAIGGLGLGLVALAGLSAGGLCYGGVSIGLAAFGGLAVGWLAFGGLAVGWLACGGGAFAWRAALGGLAVAHDYALGGEAIASHAGDAAAHAYMAESWFMRNGEQVMQFIVHTPQWLMFTVIASPLLLLMAVTLPLAYRRRRA